ncbi:MAG: hypothetical protein V1872_10190 [bacterium]
MSKSEQKQKILENGRYIYNYKRKIYYNRIDKKIFSLEAIDNNEPSWLDEKIGERKNNNGWHFYFNNAPSDKIKDEILKELEK